MIYFFHHYELPVIIQQAQVQQILRLRTRQRHQQQNGNGTHGVANNATNMRHGSNAANQANNNVMGNNQMNNNGNNPNNNNHRNGNLFASISMMLNVQTLTTVFNQIWNAFGALQGRITNDVFGTAAFFNNNNDNSLNNNNNPTANITRLRINLSRLRRINLAGIQINPIQINPAEGTDSGVRLDRDESGIGGGGDGSGSGSGNGEGGDGEPMAATVVEHSAFETSTSHSNESSRTTPDNEPNFSIQHEFGDRLKHHEHSTHAFDAIDDTDFDIIDANDDIEIKQNDERIDDKSTHHLKSNSNVSQMVENPMVSTNERPFYSNDLHNDGSSFSCDDIQVQPISSSSSNDKYELCNTTATFSSNPIAVDRNQMSTGALYIANELNSASPNSDHDERHLQRSNENVVVMSTQHTESYNQIKSLDSFPRESSSWIQGDRKDHSLINTNIGICTELDGSKNRFASQSVTMAPSNLDDTNETEYPKAIAIHSPDSGSAETIITTSTTTTDEQKIESK